MSTPSERTDSNGAGHDGPVDGNASVAVLRALTNGDPGEARALAEREGVAGGLVSALRAYLGRNTARGVYAEPSAFEEFIGTGDNPALYAATIEALRDLHLERKPRSVLDIGCGDGRVTRGCLTSTTERVDLVEPSESLLAVALRSSFAASVTGHGHTVQEFMRASAPTQRWDLAQSTFALHSLDPASRRAVLAWLAERATAVAVVEFDVPDLEPGSLTLLEHLAERYETGVAVYADHPAVIDGFLMPVLAGQLDPYGVRHTWEQSTEAWAVDLTEAGFEASTRHLFDHWWAPAHLIVGRCS